MKIILTVILNWKLLWLPNANPKCCTEIANMLPAHVSVVSVRQPQPLGLGHAVLCAKEIVGDAPFAVLLPDVLVKYNG